MLHIVKKIHNLLIKKKEAIAVAESCTGGLLSQLLTELPRSSQYFILGLVLYSNSAKENILKIPASILKKRGAVSENIARLMAKSVRLLAKADFGIGVTGIAGPAGDAKEKPVGTVFIAIDSKNKKICRKFRFTGNRTNIRRKSALKTLELLKKLLINR
ncbi:MAG: CinA family protein [Candidatus Omnitrophica bacterium]|nr:CinA family protein [Candidatus Omnitrophota bacterium]MDD5592332.1 CinA family protein [Candidatus Omnitrophota bacterium]